MHPVDQFVEHLSAARFPNVSNPYAQSHCRYNLRAYLHLLLKTGYSGRILIGEAPGHRGCALTGIPFTSERILNINQHPFIRKLSPNCQIKGNSAEATATIVWSTQAANHSPDAFWNIFPFHPHKPGVINSNRAPEADEIQAGIGFLEQVLQLLAPKEIVCVGQKASKGIGQLQCIIPISTARHPSNGGKPEFIMALSKLKHGKSPSI